MQVKLYNTPIEISIRCLMCLKEIGAFGADLERIMYFDYLCLNTSDLDGPESLHPPIPNRGVQVYARKDLIKKGLIILMSKELIELRASSMGFIYIINASGIKFLEYFQTQYFMSLLERIQWTQKRFRKFTNKEIKTFIDANLQKWGGEFMADKLYTK